MSTKPGKAAHPRPQTPPATFPEAAVVFLHEALEFAVLRAHGPVSRPWQQVAAWLARRNLDAGDLERLYAADKLPAEIRRAVRGAGGPGAFNRHVSGEQLCFAVRDLARRHWGRMAAAVLAHWGIHSTRDIGRLVFALIDAGRLQKQPGDRIEDFDDVFDFARAFDAPLDANPPPRKTPRRPGRKT